ncbi:hypothetical protein M1E08_14025 [Erwinia sp. PK3-005]
MMTPATWLRWKSDCALLTEHKPFTAQHRLFFSFIRIVECQFCGGGHDLAYKYRGISHFFIYEGRKRAEKPFSPLTAHVSFSRRKGMFILKYMTKKSPAPGKQRSEKAASLSLAAYDE